MRPKEEDAEAKTGAETVTALLQEGGGSEGTLIKAVQFWGR